MIQTYALQQQQRLSLADDDDIFPKNKGSHISLNEELFFTCRESKEKTDMILSKASMCLF